MHEFRTWTWSIDLEMDEHIHGWTSFINLDEMNGYMIARGEH
jgi:hypothetical protein